MVKPHKKILKNGIRVIVAPQASSLAVTVLILVEAGSEYEDKHQSGISHFLEHMTFKGTIRRPKPGMIATELDGLGAESNAFTSHEYTGYWAKAESKRLPEILDIVSDLYLNPTFDPAEIEKEKGVVVEEINMYEDAPMRRVQDLFTTLLYGDQPAGRDVLGTKEVVRSLKKSDFASYRDRHYVAPATTVVVAGNVRSEDVIRDVEKIFSHVPRKAQVTKPKTKDRRQRKPEILLKFKESDQGHLVLGAPAFDVFDERRYAAELLGDILGGGMSSRLFHRVREELGAAYYVRAASELFVDHGYFSVSAGVDNARIGIVLRAILEEFYRLRVELVEPKELRKSKDHLIGGLILNLETSDELASFYGSQEILTRKVLEPKEIIERVQAVTPEEIRAVAKRIFREGKLNLAVVGPYKRAEMLRKILVL
ncbi:insulinase family protein [Candidatus Parcubacteria bacterium]|nr:MAG: insulinase family protein [Candidatus Parcubacteria bacterium]